MAVSVMLRTGLVFYSQKYLQSDEALVGMMAMDVMEGGKIPIFPYGNRYAGGHIFDLLLMIPWFKIFGPSDVIVTMVPAMISCLYIWIVHRLLYQFFGKKLALVASMLFSFSATFLAFNFYENGGMTTAFFGWLGIYFFFQSHFSERERPVYLVLAGVSLGFAYYCFDYALFYFVSVMLFWAFKERFALFRRWKFVGLFLLGFAVGATPLLYYNFTLRNGHYFDNFQGMLLRPPSSGMPWIQQFLLKVWLTIYFGLPSFFGIDIYDYQASVPIPAYAAYAIFASATVWASRFCLRPLLNWMGSFRVGGSFILPREQRILYPLLMLILYLGMHCVSSFGGGTPRYFIPLYPLIPILIGWAGLEFASLSRPLISGLAVVYFCIQAFFIWQLGSDKTTVEWMIRVHGEDIKTLSDYLLKNGFTTVMTPYEIKWKLMFESKRRIVCASYMFGFDREQKYNLEVIDRVNSRNVPLTVIFDKDYQYAEVGKKFNPDGGFNLKEFHDLLEKNKIKYEITPIGDYVVLHDFSSQVALPDPYHGHGKVTGVKPIS